MTSINSLSKQRIVVAVDGGIHGTKKGMTGGVGMIAFHLASVSSNCFVVKSISVLGRFFPPNPKDPITNNKMELMGFAIMASNLVNELDDGASVDRDRRSINIEFWSDSTYALGILFHPKWIPKKNKTLVANAKRELDDLVTMAIVSGNFVRGHKGHFINEFADLVAATSIQRQKNIQHKLSFNAVEVSCLFCDNFPCQITDNVLGRVPIKNWKDRFEAMRSTSYESPCAQRKAYDAEFTITRPPDNNAENENAGGAG